ncbi:hypothetical protein [Streptomyces lunaelactis]|uniref:hypothetical protein n=1 Tax=Streptomyces lunaelactis TaxID=1535768 RepID=UPI001C3094BE
MTATPRVWQAGEADEDKPGSRRAQGELVTSMLDDPDGLFGSVAYHLPLEEAIERGIVAPYQVLVVDVQDPALNTVMRTSGDGSEEVRGTSCMRRLQHSPAWRASDRSAIAEAHDLIVDGCAAGERAAMSCRRRSPRSTPRRRPTTRRTGHRS